MEQGYKIIEEINYRAMMGEYIIETGLSEAYMMTDYL